MKRVKSVWCLSVVLTFSSVFMSGTSSVAAEVKTTTAKQCVQCHQAESNVLRGTLGGISAKAETVQVETGATWIIKFGADTKVLGWTQPINKIPKEKEISVVFNEKDGRLYAESISVKPPAKIREGQLIKVEEVAQIVSTGRGKGDYLVVDSRPGPKFGEGHIPGAINIYDEAFDQNTGKLPKEKDRLLIFYCAGPT